jgi:hypothetical protein
MRCHPAPANAKQMLAIITDTAEIAIIVIPK